VDFVTEHFPLKAAAADMKVSIQMKATLIVDIVISGSNWKPHF
jgi:hypothetical protein